MALSRIFYLYRADRSSKVKNGEPGENHLTIRKQNLAFQRDPSKTRTTAVRNLLDYKSTLLSTRLQHYLSHIEMMKG